MNATTEIENKIVIKDALQEIATLKKLSRSIIPTHKYAQVDVAPSCAKHHLVAGKYVPEVAAWQQDATPSFACRIALLVDVSFAAVPKNATKFAEAAVALWIASTVLQNATKAAQEENAE